MQVVADLRTGRGGIVTISGEAGLGKSRLLAEWRKAVRMEGDNSPVRWVEGRCVSYGASVAYHLSIDLLRSLVGVPAEASEQEIHLALRRSLQECCGTAEEAQEIHAFLGHMLGLQLDDAAGLRVKYLDGPALQSRYVAAFKSYLKALARIAPTIVVVEDIHWADPSSVELGMSVLPIAAEEPLVFVLVTRPDRDSAGWRLVNEAREIPGVSSIELHLSPLTENDSQLLISNLLEVAALPDPVRRIIQAKAEGNPFYVEEVIRMLIDRGGLQRQDGAWAVTRDLSGIEIPDTLQGVIMARIDRLPEDAKHALQVASVIGRRFQVKVLESVLRSAEQKG
jgi:predicted ATPase